MSLDVLEAFPNVQVFAYGVSSRIAQPLVGVLQNYGLHLRVIDGFDLLKSNLAQTPNALIFHGGSDADEYMDQLQQLNALLNSKESLLVVCLDVQGKPINASQLDLDIVADVVDSKVSETLIKRKCAMYLELLQRRSLFEKEEKMIQQMAYQKDRLLSILPDGVLKVTGDGYLVDLNQSAVEALGYGPEELVGAHLSQILCEPASEDPLLDWCEHSIYSAMATQQDADIEDTCLWRSDGSLLPVDCEIATLYPGQEPEYLIVFQDISIRKTEEAELNQLTRYDPVTGLANVSLMRHFLLKAMARALRNDRRLAVVYIDLDDFHCINESFGMSGGNSLLKSVGRRLKNCIRTGDLVSRYQDDAFMVVLDEVRHESDVEKVVQQMMEKLNTPHDLSGVPVVAHASIGIAFYPQGSIGIDKLVEQATEAMQWVKLNGKNNLHVAGSEKQLLESSNGNSFMH